MLETLMLYFTNEYFLCKDADFGLWTLFGVIVQFAMRMGYHRDPKHFRGMPLLASEMRRRVWASIVQIDTSISIQMGLPRLIKPWQADTEEPRNLLDKDLDQNTTELPKERAATEITPMLYWILKGRLIAVLGSISDFTADTRPYTYADVMKLEGKLEDTRSSIPECLRWRSITQCVTESPLIIVQKMFLELTFYNAKIILHRKYLFLSPIQSHDYSVDVCVDSALRILEFQHMLDEETQPFGQLYQERWRATSIVNHVFLLATSILCFYLQRSQSHAKSRDPAEETRLEKIQGSLRRSQDIWLRSSGTSREAQKGARALGVMLKKLDSADTSGAQKNPTADLPQLPDDNDSAWFQGETRAILTLFVSSYQ